MTAPRHGPYPRPILETGPGETDRRRGRNRGGIGPVVLSAPAGGPGAVGGGTARPGGGGKCGRHQLLEQLQPPEHRLHTRVRPDGEGLPGALRRHRHGGVAGLRGFRTRRVGTGADRARAQGDRGHEGRRRGRESLRRSGGRGTDQQGRADRLRPGHLCRAGQRRAEGARPGRRRHRAGRRAWRSAGRARRAGDHPHPGAADRYGRDGRYGGRGDRALPGLRLALRDGASAGRGRLRGGFRDAVDDAAQPCHGCARSGAAARLVDRPRRRYRLRAVHRDPAPQGRHGGRDAGGGGHHRAEHLRTCGAVRRRHGVHRTRRDARDEHAFPQRCGRRDLAHGRTECARCCPRSSASSACGC